MSPTSAYEHSVPPAPLCASTPRAPRTLAHNGHHGHHGRDAVENTALTNADVVNGNVHVNVVSESTNNLDVLSGGESDAGDTLSRRNNNSISSNVLGTLRESTGEHPRKRNTDITYYIAKELLMTERTYKRDLELVTVTWSRRISQLSGGGGGGSGGGGGGAAAVLARACLALEPLALPAGAFLARLEKTLTHAAPAATRGLDSDEPEYKKIADILYDYLTSIADAQAQYVSCAGACVGASESARRRDVDAAKAANSFETTAPLPLACLLLRPLHRALHLHTLAHELDEHCKSEASSRAVLAAREGARGAAMQLLHAENLAALCQLQRDIAGYDKILVPDREFIRLGCVYKHSTIGIQQRMLFLFNDVLVVASKSEGSKFRAHAAHALHALRLNTHSLPHSFTLTGEDVNLVLNASNEQEFEGWYKSLELAIDNARDKYIDVDTQLTPHEPTAEWSGSGGGGGGALSAVCWHRATALDREQLHHAMRTQLSGYLLRKFKKSPGWQKLWVVFAMFTLYFYKVWQDETPLASLPLLGYSVGPPEAGDGIDKDFVFKLQFKNHVYFFRADSQYTYNRWTDVLQTAMLRTDHN